MLSSAMHNCGLDDGSVAVGVLVLQLERGSETESTSPELGLFVLDMPQLGLSKYGHFTPCEMQFKHAGCRSSHWS